MVVTLTAELIKLVLLCCSLMGTSLENVQIGKILLRNPVASQHYMRADPAGLLTATRGQSVCSLAIHVFRTGRSCDRRPFCA